MCCYHYEEDIFVDEKGYLLPDVRDIVSWCLMNNEKYQSFNFKRKSQKNCRIIYKALLNYKKEGKFNDTPIAVLNFLLLVLDKKFFQDKETTYDTIYTPFVINGIGLYINLLTTQGLLLNTVITNKKYKYSVDMINYFRYKLSLEYYLLGIEEKVGYLVYCSLKTAVRTIEIDNLLSHERCEKIIKDYFNANSFKK